jgi:hypothetical protein
MVAVQYCVRTSEALLTNPLYNTACFSFYLRIPDHQALPTSMHDTRFMQVVEAHGHLPSSA